MSKLGSALPGAEYVHGTTVDEQSRLTALNAITNKSFVDYLAIQGCVAHFHWNRVTALKRV